MAVLGCPDTDVVLSGQELLDAIADLLEPPPDGGEDVDPPVELKRVSENTDLRVGERASKRRRNAGTATLAVLEQSALLHAKKAVQPSRTVGAEAPRGLPAGWSVTTRVIGDGRRYKRYEVPDGRVFQSYEKAKAYWDQNGQSPAAGRRRRKEAAAGRGDAAVMQLSRHPESLASLAGWLRDKAACGGAAGTSDAGFVDAALLARAACLDVRTTRTK